MLRFFFIYFTITWVKKIIHYIKDFDIYSRIIRSWFHCNSLVNLCNRTGEERRRQTLYDKRENNFVSKNLLPNFKFL